MRASKRAAQERYTIVNRGGYEVVTITDARGHLLRRYRRFPDGREYGLIDNRRRFGRRCVRSWAASCCSASWRQGS